MTGKFFDRLLTAVMVIIAAALLVIVSWQIAARTLGEPTTWTEEASRWAFIWANFIGFIYLSLKNKHLTVDVVGAGVRRRLGFRLVFAACVLLGVLSLATVAYGGWLYQSDMGSFPSKAMGLPRWILLIAVPISFGGMALTMAWRLVRQGVGATDVDIPKSDEQVYGS